VFEFDPAKSEANLAKHGIDFVDAQALWLDDELLLLRSRPEEPEERWLAIGQIDGKCWTAIITYREGQVRLISVRRSRDNEARLYGDQDQDAG
jgi:uncharacterized DUF497 family protein